jgi:cytochrome c oxidase assembly protein subunit 11
MYKLQRHPIVTAYVMNMSVTRRAFVSSSRRSHSSSTQSQQKNAYNYYRQQQEASVWRRWFQRNKKTSTSLVSLEERHTKVAYYALALVIGSLGATYAAVPLYKVFCQTTGFGGTTQRVQTGTSNQNFIARYLQSAFQSVVVPTSRGHSTWTDEDAAARLATLTPVAGADLITVRFDTTTSELLPWSFTPVVLDVKVVPGETCLAFFRVTNHSTEPITGVATYNVFPPKVGLHFQKIQCFCFEEQRLLPGETVDMPVFFFLDPAICDDAQISYVRDITLSYTFFRTDDHEDDDE